MLLEQARFDLGRCHSSTVGEEMLPHEKLRYRLTVAQDGGVRHAGIETLPPGRFSGAAEACFLDVLRRLSFDPPRGSGALIVGRYGFYIPG
jgi:hypothetical protein